MVKHPDTKVTVIEEVFYTHTSLKTGGMACHAEPPLEVPGSARWQRREGEMRARVFIVALLWNRQGRGSRFWTGSFE